METDSVRRRKLLQQVKRGRQTGATQLARIFVMLVAGAEMVNVVWDVHRGKGTLILLTDAIVIIFIVAMAGIGLSILEMNERFAGLIDLIGEDNLLGGSTSG